MRHVVTVVLLLLSFVPLVSGYSANQDVDDTPLCIPLKKWIHIEQKCFKRDKVEIVIREHGVDDPEEIMMMNYAYKLGGIEFVKLLNSENQGWNPQAINWNTNGTTDHGLCQLNSRYHSPFINDTEDFNNPYIQIRYCYDVWQKAWRKGEWKARSTFCGYDARNRRGGNIYYVN